MQKKIIALAVAGLASTAAFAQSNVTIYGLLDASAYVTDGNGNKQANYGFLSNAVSTSRLGFKGTEDLGNGLKGVFNLETELSLATGQMGSSNSGTGAGTFSRAANVGLETKVGTVVLGRQASPMYSNVAASDVLGANSGGLTNAWVYTNVKTSGRVGAAATGVTNSSFAANLQNGYVAGVGYASPVFAGVQVKAFTNFGNNTPDADFEVGGLRDLSLSYTGFGANVRLGYQEMMAGAGSAAVCAAGAPTTTTVTGSNVTFTCSPAVAGSGRVEQKNALVGADYTIGGLKLAAAYVRTSFDNALAASDVNTASIGATYQMGKANIGASFTDSRGATAGTGENNSSRQYAVMAKYDLSKRTNIYALGTYVDNRGGASLQGIYSANTLTASGTADAVNPMSLALGVRHSF